MHTRTSISLLLLALAPFASAQESTLGFDDASFDVMPPPASAWADLVAGRAELADDKTLRTTLELGLLPEVQPGMAYLFLFEDDLGRRWFTAAVTAPTLIYLFGTWQSDDEGPSDSTETTGSYSIGPGGTIVVDMPLSQLGNATLLSVPRGLTGDIKGGAPPGGVLPPFIPFDEAKGTGELRLPAKEDPAAPASAPGAPAAEESATPAAAADDRGTPTPAPADPARVPAFGALAAIGALVGALLAARRRA